MTRYSLQQPSTGQMGLSTVRAAWPVTAEAHKAAGWTANWLAARGVPIVIDGGHMFSGGTGSVTRTLNYRCRVDDVHSFIGVMITAQIDSSDGDVAWPVSFLGEPCTVTNTPTMIHLPGINISGNAELAIGVEVSWIAKSSLKVLVNCLHFYEAPVSIIDPTGVESIEVGSQIYDGYDNRESIAGLERTTEELRSTYFRRGTLFNWASGFPDGANTTSTSYQALFEDGILPAIQTRLMYTGETTRVCKVNVYARVSGGTGNVRITMGNGDVVTFNVTSTSNTWHTTTDIDVETDDPSTWDSDRGIRGGSRDTINVEYRAGAGQTIFLLGVSIWDAPGD